jgi:hypothetical protein
MLIMLRKYKKLLIKSTFVIVFLSWIEIRKKEGEECFVSRLLYFYNSTNKIYIIFKRQKKNWMYKKGKTKDIHRRFIHCHTNSIRNKKFICFFFNFFSLKNKGIERQEYNLL